MSSAEIEARASEQDILFIETSAKEGQHTQSPPPWQCPSSAPAPPQGAPFGAGQLGTPRKRPGHRLGCSSEPPPTPPISPPLTIQEGFNIKLLFRRLATALPNLESSAAPPNDPQVVNLTAPPPTAAATAAKGGCAAGCY